MDEKTLSEIEARNKARTPGGWEAGPLVKGQAGDYVVWVAKGKRRRYLANVGNIVEPILAPDPESDLFFDMEKRNACFVAACSLDIPALTKEIRRCWQRIAELEEEDRVWDKHGLVEIVTKCEQLKQRIVELEAKVKVMEYTIIDKCSDMSKPEKQIVDLRGRNRKLASKLTAAVMEVARLAAQVEAIQGKE